MLVTPSSSVRTVKPATAVANHRRFAGGRTPGAAARSRSTSASTVTDSRLVVVSDQRSSYPEHHCHDVESLVIAPESIVILATAVTSGAILIRWSSGARNIPWRTIPSSKAFSNGWTPPRTTVSRHSIRSSTHWNMPASMPGTARSSGPTANGYRSSSQWSASTLSIRACLATRSKLTCWAGSKTVRQNPASNTNSRNSTGSSSRGSMVMSARHEPPGSSRELGTLEMYKDDADFVSVRGHVGLGREAAEKGLRRIFETRAKAAMLKTEDVKIRFIRSDVALAHVTNELSGLVAPDGQTLPAHRELSLRVFVKDDGTWRVASFHNTMLSPFAGPVPSKP